MLRIWFLVLFLTASQVDAEVVHLAVASNFLVPAKVLAKRYQDSTGQAVLVSTGSTGKLFAQILNGAPFDVFFAANSREPKRLERQGRIVNGSRFTYALGRLVLWRLEDAKHGEAWLKQGDYSRLALANPKTAPYGTAANSVLQQLGIASSTRLRLVRGENVSQAYQFIASGNVDAGFVSLSQVIDQDPDSYWLVPESYYSPIRQQVVLLNRAKEHSHAKAFMAWLRAPDTAALIRGFGYGVEIEHDA